MKYDKIFGLWVLIFSLFFTNIGCSSETNKTNLETKTIEGVYRYAQSNAFNLGQSKMKSTIIIKGQSEISTLEAMAYFYNLYDIIGVEEVSTSFYGSQAVAKIVANLNNKGGSWDYLLSNPTIGPGTEKFALIFRKDKFEGLHAPHSVLVKELENDIDREPYHAILKEKKSGKLLHIYLFHLQPYKKSEGKDPEKETLLIGEKASVFEKTNVIMSGDFNLPAKKLSAVFEDSLGLKHWINEKTSLKNKEVNGDYRAFEYDNIFTSSGIEVFDSGVFDFVPLVGDLKESKKISDHLIPWVRFKIK